MKKEYRSIPIGVLAASIATVYDWWYWEVNIVNILSSIGTFVIISAAFSIISEGIISSTEKAESKKEIAKISLIVATVIFVFAFLVKNYRR